MITQRLLRMARYAAATLALTVAADTALAQTYPRQRINFVVGFSAGGFADTLARVIAQKLSERFKQTVTVENQTGAGGNTATARVAASRPDGYTVLITTTAAAINQTLHKDPGYQLEQLAALAIPAYAPEILAAHPSRPARLPDFIAWAKTQKEINYASGGVGTGSHLTQAYFFKEIAKVNAAHVPFRGGALATQAGIGGQVHAVASALGVAAHIRQGLLTGLAVASSKRLPILPDTPTYAESGYPGFEAASWAGFFVAGKTDPAIVARLNAEINAIVDEPATRKQLTDGGYNIVLRSPKETQDFLTVEVQNWAKMVRTLGLSVE